MLGAFRPEEGMPHDLSHLGADFGLKQRPYSQYLFLHSSDDENFTRRLETAVSLIFAKLALNLLPGFRARGLG